MIPRQDPGSPPAPEDEDETQPEGPPPAGRPPADTDAATVFGTTGFAALAGPRGNETFLAIGPETLARVPTELTPRTADGEETRIPEGVSPSALTSPPPPRRGAAGPAPGGPLLDPFGPRACAEASTPARKTDPFGAALFEGLGCLGRYQIEKQLGRGGMGAVYLARQLDLDRRVVVKVISGDDVSFQLVERLQREARTAARITSDFVVKVFEAGQLEDVPFIAMEYVEGRSLEDVLRDEGPLAPVEAARLMIDAARGLEAAHEAGVLHRDVKPGNILRTREGRAKVADFGLAKGPSATAAGVSLTDAGTTLGTPEYMAPEQAHSTVGLDGRADVYALGVTLYQLLTGSLPFQGRSVLDTLSQKLSADLIPPRKLDPRIPVPIEDVVLAMVARSRDERLPNMREVIQRLEAALAALPDAPTENSFSFAIRDLGKSTLKPEMIAPDERDDLPVPGRFGRYELRRIIGRGGMGAVYLAQELELDRPVVVKVIRAALARNRAMVERLRREAKAAGRIESDFVVKVFDAGEEDGRPFIAMEYVEGISLATLLQRKGRLGALEAARSLIGAARGLQAAHRAGILHRDVKPGNLLLARNGRVKVADFGIAKPQDAADITTPGTLLGTPVYASPEQLDGKKLDERADVFSLGVTFYVLVTGVVPYPGKSTLEVLQSRQQPLVSPRVHVPELPVAAEKVCLALMAEDPEKRPKDMAAAIELLTPLASDSPAAEAGWAAKIRGIFKDLF